MTKLEDHLEGIVNIFHQYSVRRGDPDTLTKGELKQLIMKEFANTLENTKDQATVDKIFNDLDTNKDGQITFNEFVSLIATLVMAAHDNSHTE